MAAFKVRTPSMDWACAFDEKCSREREKMHTKLGNMLKQDLLNLLETGTEADVTIHFKEGTVECHRCLIEIRLPQLWSDVLATDDSRAKLSSVISRAEFMQILRFIYTEDDLSPVLLQLEQMYTKLRNLPGVKSQSNESPQISTEKAGSSINSSIENGHLESPKSTPGLENGSIHSAGEQDGKAEISREKNDLELPTPSQTKYRTYCGLGHDLQKLYFSSNASDVLVKIRNQNLSLHRCILCCRSRYFSAMLSGRWRESAAKEINLEGINALAMSEALLHIYGGLPDLSPESTSITELITIADMYGLDGLKDIVSYHLKVECHFFHKPCQDCVHGVLSMLPMAHMFGLEEIYEKGLRWCSRHVSRTWAAKQFAGLPQDIQDHCLKNTLADINNDTVIDMVMECDKLTGSLTNVRWSEPVVAMAAQLMETCIEHLKQNFVRFTHTDKFLSLGKTMALGIDFLTDIFSRVIFTMPTDKACATYSRVHELQVQALDENCPWNDDFKQMICSLEEKCEHFMRLYINQLINTDEWKTMLSSNLQEKIKDGAWYVCVGDGRRMRGPPRMAPYKAKVTVDDAAGPSDGNKRSSATRPKHQVPKSSKLPINRQNSGSKNVPVRKPDASGSSQPSKAGQSKDYTRGKLRKSGRAHPKSGIGKTSNNEMVFQVVKTDQDSSGEILTLSPMTPTIRPKVRKSSAGNDTNTTHDDTKYMTLASVSSSFLKPLTKRDSFSNMSYPSNVATINSPVNSLSDFDDSGGSFNEGSEVFDSPAPDCVEEGGIMFTSVDFDRRDREGIQFVEHCFVVHCQLVWLFFQPGN